ncbi:MAG: hypothetical protein WBP22_04760 [Candidatus Saccharimonas sp.]
MTYLIILGVYSAVLFAIAWLSRRSLGVPTLTLAAGALMADLWTDSLTPLVAQAGLEIVKPPLTSVVAVALTLLPALLVMVRQHKVSSHYRSVLGSLVFAVLGVLLTYAAFSNAVVLDEASRQYALEIAKYQNIVITVCVSLAVAEVLFYKKPHSGHSDKKH